MQAHQSHPLLLAHAILLLVISPLSAGHLLIRTDGASQWVRNLKTANDRVTAFDESTGESIDLDKNAVAAAIPIAQRGAAYPLSEVSNVLARIHQIQPRFPKLKKQLNQLKQEWEPFLKTDSSLSPAIEKAVADFRSSPRNAADWKAAQSALDMIKYRDVRGELKPRIDELLIAFRGEYLATNRIRLLNLSTQAIVGLETFYQALQMKEDLLSIQPDIHFQTEILTAFDRCRSNVFQQVARKAQTNFKANPTLAGYLPNVALLFDLRDDVAPYPALKDKMSREISSWQSLLKKNNPDLTFEFEGYPLGADDRRLTELARRHSPLFIMQTQNGREDCFLVPIEIPNGISRNRSGTWKARAIFSRTPPPNRHHVLVLLIHPETGPQAFRLYLELPDFTPVTGRCEFEVPLDISTLPRDFRPTRQDDGSVYLIVFLAAVTPDLPKDQLDENKATAISKGWGVPLAL